MRGLMQERKPRHTEPGYMRRARARMLHPCSASPVSGVEKPLERLGKTVVDVVTGAVKTVESVVEGVKKGVEEATRVAKQEAVKKELSGTTSTDVLAPRSDKAAWQMLEEAGKPLSDVIDAPAKWMEEQIEKIGVPVKSKDGKTVYVPVTPQQALLRGVLGLAPGIYRGVSYLIQPWKWPAGIYHTSHLLSIMIDPSKGRTVTDPLTGKEISETEYIKQYFAMHPEAWGELVGALIGGYVAAKAVPKIVKGTVKLGKKIRVKISSLRGLAGKKKVSVGDYNAELEPPTEAEVVTVRDPKTGRVLVKIKARGRIYFEPRSAGKPRSFTAYAKLRAKKSTLASVVKQVVSRNGYKRITLGKSIPAEIPDEGLLITGKKDGVFIAPAVRNGKLVGYYIIVSKKKLEPANVYEIIEALNRGMSHPSLELYFVPEKKVGSFAKVVYDLVENQGSNAKAITIALVKEPGSRHVVLVKSDITASLLGKPSGTYEMDIVIGASGKKADELMRFISSIVQKEKRTIIIGRVKPGKQTVPMKPIYKTVKGARVVETKTGAVVGAGKVVLKGQGASDVIKILKGAEKILGRNYVVSLEPKINIMPTTVPMALTRVLAKPVEKEKKDEKEREKGREREGTGKKEETGEDTTGKVTEGEKTAEQGEQEETGETASPQNKAGTKIVVTPSLVSRVPVFKRGVGKRSVEPEDGSVAGEYIDI